VTEQQTAPAKANREYRSRPVGAVGLSLRGIDLAGAGGGGRGVGGHFAGMDEKRRKWSGEVWWLKLDRRRLRARDS
jgi:hypothetical protein